MQIKLMSKTWNWSWLYVNLTSNILPTYTLNQFQCGINFPIFTQLSIAIQTELKLMLHQVLTNIWHQIDIKVPAGTLYIAYNL